MSHRREYIVRVWDADDAEAKYEVRCTARELARCVDDAEARIPVLLAMRSLEWHILYVVVASGESVA